MQKIRTVKFNFIMNLILTGSNFLFPLLTSIFILNLGILLIYKKLNKTHMGNLLSKG